jgi:hypothetical protein
LSEFLCAIAKLTISSHTFSHFLLSSKKALNAIFRYNHEGLRSPGNGPLRLANSYQCRRRLSAFAKQGHEEQGKDEQGKDEQGNDEQERQRQRRGLAVVGSSW